MQLPPVDRSPLWRPQGADLYSTGASGAVPVRPIHAANPVESMDRLGEGAIVKTPEKPSDPDTPNRDWTLSEEKKEVEETPPEPPKEPIYKQLLEFIQSMWRASGPITARLEPAPSPRGKPTMAPSWPRANSSP